MKTLRNIILPLAILLVAGGSVNAQKFPIVLTQTLPWAPVNIVANSTKEISVVCDTANYIAIVTYGTFEEADSLRFPKDKIKFDSENRKLSFTSNGFPYNSGIQVHTDSKNLNLDAKEYSKITLTNATDDDIHLRTLTLNAENGSIIEVAKKVVTDNAYIDAKDYGWIRHRGIKAKNKKTNAYGAGRIVEIGGEVEESPLSSLFNDHREIPLFMDWSLGTSTLGITPFGGFNAPTGNFIWGIRPMGYFSYTFRWAFYQKPQWDISIGFGTKLEWFHAGNAYLSLNTDATTGITNLEAVDASSLFASEEQAHGKILWNSHLPAIGIILFPIRLEWKTRADYKGLHIGGELRPGFAFYRKNCYLIRSGYYMDEKSVASTRDESLGKYINPFQLGLRLNVGYNRVSAFAETSLTPLFRTGTESTANKPVLGQKLYPFSIGINFTL